MNRRATIVAVFGFGFFVAICAGAFFATHERKEVEVREPPRGEARSNRYLALERLWERYDYQVDSVDYREQAPALEEFQEYDEEAGTLKPAYHTVFFAGADSEVPEETLDDWRRWVSEGGTLITVAAPGSSPTVFQREFGFEISESPFDESSNRVEGPRFEWEWWRATSTLSDWTGEDRAWMTDADDALALEKSVGAGSVFVLSTAGPLSNSYIGEAEHAACAVELLNGTYGTRVLLVRRPPRVSWVTEVIDRTWPALVGAGLILLLALQAGRVRFGPMVPDPERDRRRRLEHVEAVGRFLWKQRESTALAEASRQALYTTLRQKRRLGREIRNPTPRQLAEALDVSEAKARYVLQDPQPKPTDFTAWIRQIETYRRNL